MNTEEVQGMMGDVPRGNSLVTTDQQGSAGYPCCSLQCTLGIERWQNKLDLPLDIPFK